MYELTGKISNISNDYFSKRVLLTLAINDSQSVKNCYDDLNNVEKLSITIEKFKEKRSSEANRYFWKLCGELAKKLSLKEQSVSVGQILYCIIVFMELNFIEFDDVLNSMQILKSKKSEITSSKFYQTVLGE